MSGTTDIEHAGQDGTVAARRRALNLTQADLGVLADCSRTSVAMIEGGYTPRRSAVHARITSTLTAIESALDVALSLKHAGDDDARSTPSVRQEPGSV